MALRAGSSISLLTHGLLQEEINSSALAAASDVREDVDRGDGVLGTLDLPEVWDVRAGIAYDNETKVGTLTVPAGASGFAGGGAAAVAAFGPDFDRVLVVDLKHQAVFPGDGFPFACTMRQTPGAEQFAGGRDGYLYRTGGSNAAGQGTPGSRVRWTVGLGSTPTVLVLDTAAAGSFLPVAYLEGLTIWVRYADTGLFVQATAETNTTGTITLTGALAEAPQAGDWLWVAPMVCGVLFAERRYEYPATPLYLRANVLSSNPAEQAFTLGVYGAEALGLTVDLDTAPLFSQRFTVADLEMNHGRVGLAQGYANRATAYALTFTPIGSGRLTLSALKAEEHISKLERLRSG